MDMKLYKYRPRLSLLQLLHVYVSVEVGDEGGILYNFSVQEDRARQAGSKERNASKSGQAEDWDFSFSRGRFTDQEQRL